MSIEAINALTTQLARLPGIGAKSAQRLAYHILDMPEGNARELAAAITRARDTVRYCPICGNKTRTMIREDTELRNFPLYCPKCKKETSINAQDMKVTLAEHK